MYTPVGTTQTHISPPLSRANASLAVQQEVSPLETRIDALIDKTIRSFPLTSKKMGVSRDFTEIEASDILRQLSGKKRNYDQLS